MIFDLFLVQTVLIRYSLGIIMQLIVILIFLVSSLVCDNFNNFLNINQFRFNKFERIFDWSYVNFTWDTYETYVKAIERKIYIPQNIMLGGIKFYGQTMFIALPKHRQGVPVTLTYLSLQESQITNNLLTPYPSWELNDDANCYNLQSILSMEIDTKGIMWAIDGVRLTNNIRCRPKMVLMDLKRGGDRIQTYVFPNELCLRNGGFLNDLVIDETDGDYAYITDNSNIDPGIIIFSRYQNRAWKIRHQTMFEDEYASSFYVNGYKFTQLTPVDGIALSPFSTNRTLYYTALSAYSLYSIGTEVLKNEEFCRTNVWRRYVQFVGLKESQTDGMMMDSKGNLYYTLIPIYGVGKWNIFEPIELSEIIYSNKKKLIWTDGFGMDQNGNLYLITTRAYSFIDPNYMLHLTPDIKFGVFKLNTGTRSYLYNDLAHFYSEM